MEQLELADFFVEKEAKSSQLNQLCHSEYLFKIFQTKQIRISFDRNLNLIYQICKSIKKYRFDYSS